MSNQFCLILENVSKIPKKTEDEGKSTEIPKQQSTELETDSACLLTIFPLLCSCDDCLQNLSDSRANRINIQTEY